MRAREACPGVVGGLAELEFLDQKLKLIHQIMDETGSSKTVISDINDSIRIEPMNEANIEEIVKAENEASLMLLPGHYLLAFGVPSDNFGLDPVDPTKSHSEDFPSEADPEVTL